MCSRESLLGAWIDPWMCSLVVDDVSVENPGPISKTSWSVFDQAKSLSFLLS
jgi:hypothetical protein